MRKIDAGFEQWLAGLSEKELEQVVSRLMRGHENEQVCMEYIDLVKSMEHKARMCSKCRRSTCERCDYIKSMRYVVRWQKPASWFMTASHPAVMGTVRFLKAT